MKLTSLVLITVAVLAAPRYCPAAVVYSNLGPGDSFDPGYFQVDPGYVLGFMFRASATEYIRSFEAPLLSPTSLDPPGLTATVEIHLRGGSSAFPTVGPLMEVFTVPLSRNWEYPSLIGVNLSGNVRLFAGMWFWVLIYQPTYGYAWFLNNTSVQSPTYYNGWIVRLEDQGAFRFTSAFIAPEPGTLALLGLGLTGLGMSRRRRLN